MKKTIITLSIVLALTAPASACPPCRWFGEKVEALFDWIEYSICLKDRSRYAQLTGRPMPPCDHNGKHDNPKK